MISEPTPVTGTKCARHFDMPALTACERCGDYICLRCLCDHDGHLYCPDCLALQPAGAKPSARVVAHLIDSMTFVVPMLLVVVPMWNIGTSRVAERFTENWMGVLLAVSVAIVGALQLLLVQDNGQSVGKRVMKLRVVLLNGEPVGMGRVLFLRNLAPLLLGSIPFIGFIFRIANIAALFSDGNRTIHDRFAGTKVIAVRSDR